VLRIASNRLRVTPILDVVTESQTLKTFNFEDKLCSDAEPGQFLMLWVPSVDEIPLSVADVSRDGVVSVAVRNVGEATGALHRLGVGGLVGVRGPFGNSFNMAKGKVLLVGGGTGIAPLLFLAKRANRRVSGLVFVVGAKTKGELLYVRELEKLCSRGGLVVATDDGSYGLKCLVTAPLEKLLGDERFDMVYTCGPEVMMAKVFALAEKHGVPMEASLERLMRCAIGLCGNCVIGRYRVCRDGPVFNGNQLREVRDEFGVSKRDFDGKKIPLT
jgi:dihydroorotate dehydrogenase electron transfer subunit